MMLWNVKNYDGIDEWFPTLKRAKDRYAELVGSGEHELVCLNGCELPPLTATVVCKIINGDNILDNRLTSRMWEKGHDDPQVEIKWAKSKEK